MLFILNLIQTVLLTVRMKKQLMNNASDLNIFSVLFILLSWITKTAFVYYNTANDKIETKLRLIANEGKYNITMNNTWYIMIDYCDEFISLFLFNMCHSGNNMKRSYNVLNGESNINLYYFYTLNDMPLTKQIFQ